jgi:hypothetical protein
VIFRLNLQSEIDMPIGTWYFRHAILQGTAGRPENLEYRRVELYQLVIVSHLCVYLWCGSSHFAYIYHSITILLTEVHSVAPHVVLGRANV